MSKRRERDVSFDEDYYYDDFDDGSWSPGGPRNSQGNNNSRGDEMLSPNSRSYVYDRSRAAGATLEDFSPAVVTLSDVPKTRSRSEGADAGGKEVRSLRAEMERVPNATTGHSSHASFIGKVVRVSATPPAKFAVPKVQRIPFTGKAQGSDTPRSVSAPASTPAKPPKPSKTPPPSGTKQQGKRGGRSKSPASRGENKEAMAAAKRSKERMAKAEASGSSVKPLFSMIVIGHVDAGKSTLMGNVLLQAGAVSQGLLHKYRKAAKELGKASFAYAWVLDEHEEERSRGVTMDVGVKRFETDHRRVTLLDAPGHRDFIPNMITGAAQADVAILVVAAQTGEFEAGFQENGQTKEHALLVRYLGVGQLVVAINKMDTCDWSKDRFDDIVAQLAPFLKIVGFKAENIRFVPVSGFTGANVGARPSEEAGGSWYGGPTILEAIDGFNAVGRPSHKPFRMCIADVYRSHALGDAVGGKIEAGTVGKGDKIQVSPLGEKCTVKGVMSHGEIVEFARAGENVEIRLNGIDHEKLSTGNMLCDPGAPVPVVSKFEAKIITLDALRIPILMGSQFTMHLQSVECPAVVFKLLTASRGKGKSEKKNPRCIRKNASGTVQIKLQRAVCIEKYDDFRPLGRFLLRSGGVTVAAGLVTRILECRGGPP